VHGCRRHEPLGQQFDAWAKLKGTTQDAAKSE
jgi:acyl-CoA-binding protein